MTQDEQFMKMLKIEPCDFSEFTVSESATPAGWNPVASERTSLIAFLMICAAVELASLTAFVMTCAAVAGWIRGS
jgi:hypothetical protein